MAACDIQCDTLSLVFPGHLVVRGCKLDRIKFQLGEVSRQNRLSRNFTTEARRHGEDTGQRGKLAELVWFESGEPNTSRDLGQLRLSLPSIESLPFRLSHGRSSKPDPILTFPSPCLRASVVKFSRLNFHDSFHPNRHLDASPIAALVSEPMRLRLTIHRLLSARPGLHGGLLGQRHAHNQSPLRTRSLP